MKRLYLFLVILTFGVPAFAGWTPPVRISERGIFNGMDGGIYPEKIYLVTNAAGPDNFVRYQESTDKGQNWSIPFVLPDSITTVNSYRAAIVKYQNWLFTAWVNIDNQGPDVANIGFRRSSNLGDTWYLPNKVFSHDGTAGFYDMGDVSQWPYAIFGDYVNGQYICRICVANAYGMSWGNSRDIFVNDHISFLHTVATGNIIHVIWNGAFQNINDFGIFYTKSSDYGITWSSNQDLRQADSSFGEWSKLAVNNRGDLVACWMDYRNSPPLWPTGDIFYRTSSDSGRTWQDEVQITDRETSRDPDVAWDGNNLCIAYVDYRNSWYTNEIYFRRSTDDGTNWQSEERLTYDSCNSVSPCLLIQSDTIYSFWCNQDPVGWDTSEYSGVFFRRFDPEPINIGDGAIHLPSQLALKAFPNPFNSTTSISYQLPSKMNASIQIFNILGQQVYSKYLGLQSAGEYNISVDLGFCPSGIYFVKMITGENNSNVIKMMLLK